MHPQAAASNKALRKRGHDFDKGGSHAHLEALVRLLVTRLTESDRASGRLAQAIDYEHVIAETELDGARYVLVRLPRPAQPSVRLSAREQEIVCKVAQGHPNKIIAQDLNISPWTVNTHLRRIFAKLGVGTRAAMVARLVASLDPPDRTPPIRTGWSQ